MPEIKLKTRIQNKYKILEEWDQLVKGDFIPLKGEVCYGIDENTLYQKVGDGKTDFIDLPWLLNQSDWLENDKTSPNYIQNRIAYTEIGEGGPILEIKYVNNDGISNPMIIQGNVAIVCEGREFAEEDLGKLWSFNLKCTNTDGTNPLEIDVPGPVEIKTFGTDGDIIYYYGNFYRFYVMYAIVELQDEIAAGDITVEDIEQMVRDELKIKDTDENYAFVNMYGTIIGAMFGVTPDDPNNFNYEFSLSSYPTIVHKLDSKYLEEVDLVGKFYDENNFSEIFNDYAANSAQGVYSHAEGYQTAVSSGNQGGHAEGYGTSAGSGNGTHAEGYQTRVNYGVGAHSEGYETISNGTGAHSEGEYTSANGSGAHSEGYGTSASGTGAHSEGGSALSKVWVDIRRQGYYQSSISTQWDILSSTRVSIPWDYNFYQTNTIATVSCDDCNNFYVYLDSGNLVSGSLSDELVEKGYLSNVYFTVYPGDQGASGEYSHTEGYGNIAGGTNSHAEGLSNHARGKNSHVEGEGNIASGENSHVGGFGNITSGSNSFVHGYNLQSTTSNQFVVGTYNKLDTDAALIVGQGSSSSPKNILTVSKNGDLQTSGLINYSETDGIPWTQFFSQAATAYKTSYYHLIQSSRIPFTTSKLIKPDTIKLQLSSSDKYLYHWKIYNGNILPEKWIESTTLDDGTTITLNADESITVTKVAGTELKYPVYNYSARSSTYCWDETANEQMYFAFDTSEISDFDGPDLVSNPGQHLIEVNTHWMSFDITLMLYAAADVAGTFTIHRPTLTNRQAPDRYLPYMEPIIVNNGSESPDFLQEIKIKEAPFFDNLVVHSNDYYGDYYIYASAVPEAVINENRIGILLDDLKEEISTSLILKSPNGTKFNITVNDDGTLSTTQI